MTPAAIPKVMRRMRRVVYHLGTFHQSYPKILKGTRSFTRSHLVVLHDCLPDLRRMVRYAADTIPTVARLVGCAEDGVASLTQVTRLLAEVRISTERAVTEILDVLDRVDPILEKAEAENADGSVAASLSEVREQLQLVLNALQFQDITSQQMEAINSMLRDLSAGLGAMMASAGSSAEDVPAIDVREGTFDASASFDRERAGANQQQIDRLVPSGDDEVEAGDPEEFSQADIDALIEG